VASTQNCGSFDSSYDSQLLLLATCHLATPAGGGQPAPLGPTTITSQPASGGSAGTLQTLPQAVTMLRAVTTNTLLLLVENHSGDTSQNGLWEMNTAGTGLAQLSSDKNNTQSLCPFTQYAWSNVSRDNTYYALQEVDPKTNTYTMYYGSLGGGAPTQFNRVTGTQVLLVGWTGL
jgi:eukaryotic-like serine/threonine-protein kinase